MRALLPLGAIEPFVRECLGCRCPAEVFEQVESEKRALFGIQFQRMLAGNRLLVYLVLDAGSEPMPGVVGKLHQLGVAERDAAGYNRLRIVLPAELTDSLRSEVIEVFADVAEGDEKVHLHFVPQERLETCRVTAV
ncbi:MAG: hypothetical protein OQL20_06845 [Sedimenticola sp.]|nr:hypothetical protein [Sedimenticola sp.]